MAKKKKSPKKLDGALKLINLKVSDDDREKMRARARRFGTGNLSQWLRVAGLNFKPPQGKRIAS